MSSLEIMLKKDSFKPGDKVEGDVVLKLDKTIKARDIVVEIYGNEHTHISRTHGSGKNRRRVTYTEDVEVINQYVSLMDTAVSQGLTTKNDDKVTLRNGFYQLPFSFTLPEDATPTYEGVHAEVDYDISAKVDIPWRFDMKDSKGLYVVSEDDVITPIPAMIECKGGSLLKPSIDLQLHLESKELKRGGEIKGKVVVLNNSGKKIRKIKLDLYANEHARASSYIEDSTVMSTEYELPLEKMYKTARMFEKEFRFGISDNIVPTISKDYFNITWFLDTSADVKMAADIGTVLEVVMK